MSKLMADAKSECAREPEEGRRQSDTNAQRLAEHVAKSGLFMDDRGRAFAEIGGLNVPIRGKAYLNHLTLEYHGLFNGLIGTEVLSKVLRYLEAQASRSGERRTLFNRVARRPDGALLLDTGDPKGTIIEVTARGWGVSTELKSPFSRYGHQVALPQPVRGGDVTLLYRHINVQAEEQRILLVAWLIATLVEPMPHPILMIHGDPGAAKTTTARLLRRLVDPSEIEPMTLPRKADELKRILDRNYMLIIDNLSHLGRDHSDLLCQAVTGGGSTNRELYSNDEDVIFKFRRALILTAIGVPTRALDLLDRMVFVEASRITEAGRRTEESILRDFNADAPRILGGMLDVLSAAMALKERFELLQKPRMADFSHWGAAIAHAMGSSAERFISAYANNRSWQAHDLITDSVIGAALLSVMASTDGFHGTATQLAEDLRGRMRGQGPLTARAVGEWLNKNAAQVAELGFNVERYKSAGGNRERMIRITRTASVPVVPIAWKGEQAATSEQSSGQSTANVVAFPVPSDRMPGPERDDGDADGRSDCPASVVECSVGACEPGVGTHGTLFSMSEREGER
jgi:hypothetical protein